VEMKCGLSHRHSPDTDLIYLQGRCLFKDFVIDFQITYASKLRKVLERKKVKIFDSQEQNLSHQVNNEHFNVS
jgi:hypothetical protein